MKQYQMGAIESRFADIIWEHEPISSAELARRSEELLAWKKTTSYTVLKRLCDKGLFVNNKGTVTSLISKAQYMSYQSEQFLNDTFEGSLPAFLAAFTAGKPLTAEEVACLRRMVAEYEGSAQ